MGNSSYLKDIFKVYKNVSIKTQNAVWRRDFYLPEGNFMPDNVRTVFFDIQSFWSVYVHVGGKEIELSYNTTSTFWTDNGGWRNGKYTIKSLRS